MEGWIYIIMVEKGGLNIVCLLFIVERKFSREERIIV